MYNLQAQFLQDHDYIDQGRVMPLVMIGLDQKEMTPFIN